MLERRRTEGPWMIVGVFALLLALAPGFLSAQSDANLTDEPEEMTETEADQEVETAEEIIGKAAPSEPADGKWLKDDEGREYFVWKLAKKDTEYRMLTDKRIRVNHFQIYVLDSEDDENLFVRVYRIIPGEGVASIMEPTPEALAEAAKTYEVKMEVVDRLAFRPFDQGLPKRGHWRNGFELADMNGDGHLDVVHCPPRKGTLQPMIFLGDGAGRWTHWSEARFPAAPYDYGDVTVADFNKDGHLDMALGIHLRGMLVLVGNGKGAFEIWSEGVELEVPGQGGGATTFSSRQVQAIDWNGDAYPDIVALGEGPRPASKGSKDVPGLLVSFSYGIVVYVNKGDGSWEKLSLGNDQGEIFGDDLKLADFNGDGRMDFATSSSAMMRRDLVNFSQPDQTWRTIDIEQVRPFSYVRAVEPGDFNGDGRTDLAVGYSNRELKVWRSGVDLHLAQKDGTWKRQTLYAEDGRRGYFALTSGDLDGDGDLDLVAVGGDGSFLTFLGDGAGNFVQEESPELKPPSKECRGYAAQLVDVDGDGKDELFANFAGERNAMFAPDKCLSNGGISVWKLKG